MKKSKICYSAKITMIKPTRKITLLALTLVATMTTTQAIHADNTQHFTKDTTTCATALVCKKLTQFIQAQIDELEVKGDLSSDDKRLRYNLKKQLIAVEKSETQNQNTLIDAKLQDQDSQIAVLRGVLLEN